MSSFPQSTLTSVFPSIIRVYNPVEQREDPWVLWVRPHYQELMQHLATSMHDQGADQAAPVVSADNLGLTAVLQ